MSSNTDDKNAKIKQVIELLKFISTVDDKEILESTVEAIIEMLQEEID